MIAYVAKTINNKIEEFVDGFNLKKNISGQQDLNILEKKLAHAKEKFLKNKPKNPTDSGAAFNLLADLIAGILVGSFVGYQIDDYFSTIPLFFFLFTIFGIAVGFYIFYKDNLIK